ncbi:hypothetical protein [Microbacterium sp. NPDC077184]|uniref:hypothetical protein n=1 Tax=Microbacterium sp. NPDC077184 TaxID=3154764 RepID=UPI0034401D52
MGARQISVETVISADMDAVWTATQDPIAHVRWDLRFSRIVPTGTTTDGAVTFDCMLAGPVPPHLLPRRHEIRP